MSDIAIGDYLRETRVIRQWTLKDVSKRSGVTVGQLSDIEHGRTNPSLNTLISIADAFEMSVAELIGGAELSLTAGEYRLLEAWRSGKWAELLALVSAKMAEDTRDE